MDTRNLLSITLIPQMPGALKNPAATNPRPHWPLHRRKRGREGLVQVGKGRTFDPEGGLARAHRRQGVLDLHQLTRRAARHKTR